MPNLIDVSYAQTGESTSTNDMGMRAMQARAYEAKDNQYLLIKAPPASGKSRALMFIALDKLYSKGLRRRLLLYLSDLLVVLSAQSSLANLASLWIGI